MKIYNQNLNIAAQKHTKEVDKNYAAEIAKAIHDSEIFRDDSKFRERIPQIKNDEVFPIESKLLDIDSVSVLFTPEIKQQLSDGRKVAILNFASFKTPGGLFLAGSAAQEEALCHCSYLYNVVKSFQTSYYAINRQDTNHALYNNSAIYSAGIRFWNIKPGEEIKEETPYVVVDVITCAAPNAAAAAHYYNRSQNDITQALRERITFIKQICQIKQVDTLIAGAFGCGVFKNKPSITALMFSTQFENSECNYPSQIIHPVPSRLNSVNHYWFRRFFNKEILNENEEIIGWH